MSVFFVATGGLAWNVSNPVSVLFVLKTLRGMKYWRLPSGPVGS